MRSSHRCSESFSCEEKYSLTSKPTLPLAAAAGFSAGDALGFAEAAFPLAFSAAFPLDFSAAGDFGAGSSLERVSMPALSGRSSLYCKFLSSRKAWPSYQSSCCSSRHCQLPAHHHQKPPAAPANHMDCGHELRGMLDCSMSCCHDSDRSQFTSIAFVLPASIAAASSIAITSPIELAKPMDFPRCIEPLSPPPRFVFAAA